jgi:betaine lipid synthase
LEPKRVFRFNLDVPSLAEFSLGGSAMEDIPVKKTAPEASDEETAVLSDNMLSDEDEELEQPRGAPILVKKDTVHVTNDHIHGQGYRWRQHFDPALIDRFSTYIYAFAWEDPRVDLEFLDLKREDKMFVITSGGCNVLEYAIQVGPQRIHSVDLNPCQNHMLELKLAALAAFNYEDYWKLLGDGFIPHFDQLLDTHLSPNLSPYAYDFWKKNSKFKNLFKTGCSGLAIRVFDFVIKLRRLQPIVERMCHSETLEEQNRIWEEELRPHLLNKWLIHILNNDRFLWGALGVPPAQMQMLLEEGVLLLM